jgi:hypothetical protein
MSLPGLSLFYHAFLFSLLSKIYVLLLCLSLHDSVSSSSYVLHFLHIIILHAYITLNGSNTFFLVLCFLLSSQCNAFHDLHHMNSSTPRDIHCHSPVSLLPCFLHQRPLLVLYLCHLSNPLFVHHHLSSSSMVVHLMCSSSLGVMPRFLSLSGSQDYLSSLSITLKTL